MNAQEWADRIVTAREEFTLHWDKEEAWRQQVAYSAGCVWALRVAGVVDRVELCNALNNYVDRIASP